MRIGPLPRSGLDPRDDVLEELFPRSEETDMVEVDRLKEQIFGRVDRDDLLLCWLSGKKYRFPSVRQTSLFGSWPELDDRAPLFSSEVSAADLLRDCLPNLPSS